MSANRFYFNIVSEAKMYSFVQMAKKYMPNDQVQQFCEVMLDRALRKEGIKKENVKKSY